MKLAVAAFMPGASTGAAATVRHGGDADVRAAPASPPPTPTGSQWREPGIGARSTWRNAMQAIPAAAQAPRSRDRALIKRLLHYDRIHGRPETAGVR
jgi:hypothetical protein